MCRKNFKLHILQVLSAIIIFSAVLPLCFIPTTAAESGTCGAGLSWTLNAGTLTISGSGDMDNYRDYGFAPWYEFRDEIVKLVIADSVTSIGDFAFYSCKNLGDVKMPNAVKRIGGFAFAECVSLKAVTFGNLLEEIGESAFYNCNALHVVRLPHNLKTIGRQAFYRCESLTVISIPRNVKTLGDSAFAYCKNLLRAEVLAPIGAVPAWTFYGCDLLTVVYLNSTVESLDNYAFKECNNLTNVYYPADEEKAEKLQDAIIVDVPRFENGGFVTNDTMSDTVTSTKLSEDENGNIIKQTNTTVMQDESITLEYVINRVYEDTDTLNGKNTFDIILTVESNDAWDNAIEQLKKPMSDMSGAYANPTGDNTINIDVYMKNDTEVSPELLNTLAGRDVKLEIISPEGNVWRTDGDSIKVVPDTLQPPKYDYSHTVEEADPDTCEKVGTDDCFKVTFKENVESKAEVLVQLPTKIPDSSNAFLYQVEDNGDYTRLQAVKVDDNSVAHFYLASVDKGTDYVIGLNVPGERTDDVIIPDELMTRYGSALERLEEIQFVSAGKRQVGGFGLGQIMIIMFIIIIVTAIVIGVVMFMINRKKLQKQNYRRGTPA